MSPGGTDRSAFEAAYALFRATPFPDRPQQAELQEWGFGLLELDTHIAGYVTRVQKGTLEARDVPNLNGILSEIESLQTSLDDLSMKLEEDPEVIGRFHAYISAMRSMAHELDGLSRREL